MPIHIHKMPMITNATLIVRKLLTGLKATLDCSLVLDKMGKMSIQYLVEGLLVEVLGADELQLQTVVTLAILWLSFVLVTLLR